MTRNVKRLLVVFLTAALIFASGCSNGSKSVYEVPELLPAAGVASDIAEVIRADHSGLKLFEGFTTAYVEELYFTVDGYVDEILVKPGDQVKKGDRLITLNLDSQRKRAESLETSIERTRKSNEFNNRMTEIDIAILETELQALIASGASGESVRLKELDIEQKKTDLRQTMETQELNLLSSVRELEELKEVLANDALIAPFDGQIARGISLSEGSAIKAYDTAIQLADNTRVMFTTEYLSETYFRSASGGYYALIGDKRYEVEMDEIDMEDYIAKTLVGDTVYSNFSIIGPEGWENEVSAGEYGVLILVNNFLADQLLIPQNAVLSDTDGKYVYVVGEDGERKKRTIKIRNYGDSLYSVVLEGLEEGERIYVTDK